MKLLKIVMVFILILFPFGELLRFELGNNIVVKPLDVIVGSIAGIFLLLLITKKVPYVKNALIRPVEAFVLVGLCSLAVNIYWLGPHELFVSFFYLLRWLSYAMLFFIVINFDNAFKQKLRWVLFFDGLIILLVGYLQYFLFPSLKSWYQLGWDEHMYRMFSVFLDPNFAGAFFVLYFLFVAGLLYRYGVSRIKHKIFFCIVLLLTLFAIFLTFSRASLLMLIVGSGLFLFLSRQRKVFFALLVIIFSFFIAVSSQFYIENINIFREASSKARLTNYATALQIIQEKPLLGIGFNSYRYAKDLYGIKTGWTGAPSHADAGVDNSFLFVLATTGAFGFVIYLWLWGKIVQQTFFARNKHIFLTTVVFSSIAGLFVHALFINSLFFAPIMLWMWLLLGLSEG